MSDTLELAASAARLIVDEGEDWDHARRKAARDFPRHTELPSNEVLEDAVREHIALFCADTQPGELQALREVARLWMQRLAAHRPHVSGAVWRGWATRLSILRLDLYADDPKAVELALINAGEDYDTEEVRLPGRREPVPVLILGHRCRTLGEVVTVHLHVHDHDDLRGALLADARGQSWRGNLAALERRMAETEQG